jgi:hypothetical protein
LAKGLVVRLILVRQQDEKRNKRWMMKLPDGVLLGKLLSTRKGENLFIVRTVLDLGMIRRQQRQLDWQFVPLDVRVFQIKNIREVHAKEKRMPTMREQISALINNNPDADYWEKLVLRLAEALLDIVDEQLRGIPREEPGLERMGFEDYENMPGRIELHDGLLAPIRWNLYQEGRHRLGYASVSEGMDSSREEILRRREALRRKPFIASQVPFPSGPPEE